MTPDLITFYTQKTKIDKIVMYTEKERVFTVLMKNRTTVEVYATTLTEAASLATYLFEDAWGSVYRTNVNPVTCQEDFTKNPDGSYLFP